MDPHATLDHVHMDHFHMDRAHGQFFLPHAKMLLVPMNFFFWRVDYALEENVLTLSKYDFLPLISYWEVVKRILIFYLFLDVKLFIAADD